MKEIILASKSELRKKMLEEENIPFEVIVSNADETPNENASFEEQLKDISMRKAKVVFEQTKERGERIIVAADQNIIFEGVMYGKPKTIEEARNLIKRMEGRKDIYSYVGNSIIYANKDKSIRTINNCDISRMSIDNISDEVLEDYLKKSKPLTRCGGITVAPFLHVEEGKISTAKGMTIEYLKEMINETE